MAVYIVLIKRLLTVYISGKVLPKMTVQKKKYIIWSSTHHKTVVVAVVVVLDGCNSRSLLDRSMVPLPVWYSYMQIRGPAIKLQTTGGHTHTHRTTHSSFLTWTWLSISEREFKCSDGSIDPCMLATRAVMSYQAATCGKHVRTTHWSFANNQ